MPRTTEACVRFSSGRQRRRVCDASSGWRSTKADMAQAGSTLPYPVDRPEAVAIPQGDRSDSADPSKLPAAGDIHRAVILQLVDAESPPAARENTSQSEISTNVDKARSDSSQRLTLERLAKAQGISRWDGISHGAVILPGACSLSESAPAASMQPHGNIPAAGDLTGISQNPLSSKAEYLNSPLAPGGELPAAVIMQDATVAPPGLIPYHPLVLFRRSF